VKLNLGVRGAHRYFLWKHSKDRRYIVTRELSSFPHHSPSPPHTMRCGTSIFLPSALSTKVTSAGFSLGLADGICNA
jgi:hypothetical protein